MTDLDRSTCPHGLPVTRDRLAEHLGDLTYRGRNLPPAHARALAEFVLRVCDVREKGAGRG